MTSPVIQMAGMIPTNALFALNSINSVPRTICSAIGSGGDEFIAGGGMRLSAAKSSSIHAANDVHQKLIGFHAIIRERAESIAHTLLGRMGIDAALKVHVDSGTELGTMHCIFMPRRMGRSSIELTIDGGTTPDEADVRLRSLNCLVHHEIAHALQCERAWWPHLIDTARHPTFDAKNVEYSANHVLIDKWAFEMARLIYVYAEEGVIGEAGARAALAIGAYLALGESILRDCHMMLPGTDLARMSAVSRELAWGPVVGRALGRQLKDFARRCYAPLVASKEGRTRWAARRLIGNYRRIFRMSELFIP